MIKKLFFTAALLVPGLAYGADPSANLPIQIVPASAVPAAAQAAGFTKLIISDNFQDPSFANTANWLDCAGASSPTWWRAWIGFSSYDGPCAAVTQAVDSANGGQPALRLHWQDSYFSGSAPGPAHVALIQTTDSAGNGRQTPPGFYMEVVARTDRAVVSGLAQAWIQAWSLTAATGVGYEIDGMEECGGGNCVSGNIHNNNGFNSCAYNGSIGCFGCPPVQGCGFDITQYHTYAWRQTSAGTDIVFCDYIDGSLEGCSSIQPTSTELAGLAMVHQLGVGVSSTNTPLGNGSAGKNMWVKSVKVWSCAAVNSGALCNSSTNNP
jgi:hypothetical protein